MVYFLVVVCVFHNYSSISLICLKDCYIGVVFNKSFSAFYVINKLSFFIVRFLGVIMFYIIVVGDYIDKFSSSVVLLVRVVNRM